MKWLAITLSLLLCDPVVVPLPGEDDKPLPARIEIVVTQGEGGINHLGQRASHEPAVRVEDEKGDPIANAAVVFTLPISGASGEFSNGSKNLTIMTDRQGTAAVRGLRANRMAGNLPIHVNVSYRGLSARTTITQFNMAVPGKSAAAGGGTILAVVLAVVGAAAAGGAYVATHKNGNSAAPAAVGAPPPIGITPGSPSIGPPR